MANSVNRGGHSLIHSRVSKDIIGKILARDIFGPNASLLLAQGTVITEDYVYLLLEKRHLEVYVRNDGILELGVDEVVKEKTRLAAVHSLEDVFQNLSGKQVPDLKKLTKSVNSIIKEIKGKDEIIISLAALKSTDDAVFVHSVNVCILSILLADSMHYSQSDLSKIGIGAILHDVGYVRTPPQILKKEGALTDLEYEIIKTHPNDGFEIIRKELNLPSDLAHMAFQHHERLDGSGYPRGLKGSEIHEFSLIAGGADFYDAITSDRSYRARLSSLQVAELLINGRKTLFQPKVVDKLLARVAIYPTCSLVLLNSGKIAIVQEQNNDDLAHPVVRVITDERRNPLIPYTRPTDEKEFIKDILSEIPDTSRSKWTNALDEGRIILEEEDYELKYYLRR